MNPHLKLAYEHGARTALQEAGIAKEAYFGAVPVGQAAAMMHHDHMMGQAAIAQARGDYDDPLEGMSAGKKALLSALGAGIVGSAVGTGVGTYLDQKDSFFPKMDLSPNLGTAIGGLGLGALAGLGTYFSSRKDKD